MKHPDVSSNGDDVAAVDTRTDDTVLEAVGVDDEAPEAFVYEPPPFDVLVRVMGNVRIEGVECRSADEEELLAVLTCLRDRSLHVDIIQEHVAPEGAKRTIQNRLSSLRRRLGEGSDGEDLLPECPRGGGNLGSYRVSDLVRTDLEMLEHRFETAKQLGSFDALTVLRDGLELMGGPLFRARKGYNWAVAEGYQSYAAQLVIAYATMLMDLAMERDDIALVLQTAAVASRVVDDPMMEVPMRRAETAYAEASGHPELVESVATAKRRLLDYVQNEDSLATS